MQGVDYYAPGVAATHPYAVGYCGEFETIWDGTAVAVRAHARALASTGLPVVLQSFSHTVVDEHGVAAPVYATGIPDQVIREVGHLIEAQAGALFPLIRHAVVRSAEHLRQIIVPKGVRAAVTGTSIEEAMMLREQAYAATILYSVWERDRVDPEIVRHLARVAQCWVPCEHNRAMLAASGVPRDKIHVVPHPFDPADRLHLLTRRPPAMHGGWKRFYSIGRWEPRKGYDQLIGAFLHAYGPAARATLTIKYTGGEWKGYPSAADSVNNWLEVDEIKARGWNADNVGAHVQLLGERMPRDKILKLHFVNNIYVACSAGEAWCLPAFEAKLAGNAMVHVPYGGTADFASPTDVQVPYRLGPVHASYGWEPAAQWAVVEMHDLSTALRAADLPVSHARPAELDRYALQAVGVQMRALALEVANKRPDVAAYFEGLRP